MKTSKNTNQHTNNLGYILYDEFVEKYGAENCVYRDELVEFYEVELRTNRCHCAKCGGELPKGSLQYKMVDTQSRNGGYTVHKDCPADRSEASEWAHEKGNRIDHADYDSENVDNHRVIVKTNKYRCEWLKRHGFHNGGCGELNRVELALNNGWLSGHILPQFIGTRSDEDEITVNGCKVSTIDDYYKAIRKRV